MFLTLAPSIHVFRHVFIDARTEAAGILWGLRLRIGAWNVHWASDTATDSECSVIVPCAPNIHHRARHGSLRACVTVTVQFPACPARRAVQGPGARQH